jgi:hypothetical protein
LISIAIALYEFISIAQMTSDPGLGGLAPYIYTAASGALFFTDVLFQFLLRSYRQAFFLCEFILCFALSIWIYSLG